MRSGTVGCSVFTLNLEQSLPSNDSIGGTLYYVLL
jgi:hypothetical protein